MDEKERKELARSSWQYRAIEATHGNQSRLGTILLAALDRSANNPPWFGRHAAITSDGFVLCDFMSKSRGMCPGAFVGSLAEVRDNFRGLADHLKLSDTEREDLFKAVRGWLATDHRAIKDRVL